jgi:septum site-determining protein MinD
LSKVVVVTSGKGGVGKTTTSAAFAAALAVRGYKTVVIMGCERRVVYDLLNVIHGEGSLNQALIKDKRVGNLYILPASQTRDKDALSMEGIGEVIASLRQSFEYIICDSPAGIEKGAMTAMYYADEALVVTNPEISSVRDSDRIIGMLASKTKRAEDDLDPVKVHLVVTRYDPARVERGDMLSADDVCEILAIPFLGVVPESKLVLAASNSGVPVTLAEDCDAGIAYFDIVDRFLGEDVPYRYLDVPKKGFFSRFFGS